MLLDGDNSKKKGMEKRSVHNSLLSPFAGIDSDGGGCGLTGRRQSAIEVGRHLDAKHDNWMSLWAGEQSSRSLRRKGLTGQTCKFQIGGWLVMTFGACIG